MARRKSPSNYPLAVLTSEQADLLARIEHDAMLYFDGSVDELERAIGLLRVGFHFGWRPLVLMHSKRTIAKYEEILGVSFREVFPAEGPSADRSRAYVLSRNLSNFWKAVSGETPVPDRQTIRR